MLVTFREMRIPLTIWAMLSVIAAIAGPFETGLSLPFTPRLVYWSAIVGFSVLLDALCRRVVAGQDLAWRLLGRIPFALILAGVIYVVNHFVFDGWQGWGAFAYLAGIVVVVTAAVEIAARLFRHAPDQDVALAGPAVDPAETFLRRLPLDKRGALIRLEAQDHYLNVITSKGAALILMRMADAEAELAGVPGLRVHRSHWVALAQVAGHIRKDGRDFLVTCDDAQVPVSRANRAAVQEVGLF